ncbi:hypothetical protein DM01DRAFT_1335753 [Hesseltinella vesiculosa]|uniref:Uncharacterized protein n=1 Tax=Hesseltinella vesiculosa TaxID=101127 RepID=A0A1X2GIW8_9FUNG|nr:hypothetical protein DM01DRAFT_1335753 [Hesseltinella vesiculosa]
MQESYLPHLDSSLVLGWLDEGPLSTAVDLTAPPEDHVPLANEPDDSLEERRRRHQTSLLSHTPVFTDPPADLPPTPVTPIQEPSRPDPLPSTLLPLDRKRKRQPDSDTSLPERKRKFDPSTPSSVLLSPPPLVKV